MLTLITEPCTWVRVWDLENLPGSELLALSLAKCLCAQFPLGKKTNEGSARILEGGGSTAVTSLAGLKRCLTQSKALHKYVLFYSYSKKKKEEQTALPLLEKTVNSHSASSLTAGMRKETRWSWVDFCVHTSGPPRR